MPFEKCPDSPRAAAARAVISGYQVKQAGRQPQHLPQAGPDMQNRCGSSSAGQHRTAEKEKVILDGAFSFPVRFFAQNFYRFLHCCFYSCDYVI